MLQSTLFWEAKLRGEKLTKKMTNCIDQSTSSNSDKLGTTLVPLIFLRQHPCIAVDVVVNATSPVHRCLTTQKTTPELEGLGTEYNLAMAETAHEKVGK